MEFDALASDVDSLNQLAYAWRYKNTDSLCYYATMAMFLAREAKDNDRQAEAMNNFMFERFQQMDFDSTLVMINKVQSLTNNQIELLIADVMGMKVATHSSLSATTPSNVWNELPKRRRRCQLTSANACSSHAVNIISCLRHISIMWNSWSVQWRK